MQRSVLLSIAAGALALGLSLSTAQAVMPVPEVTPGAHTGAGFELVKHSTYQCRIRYRRCVRRCQLLASPTAVQRCMQRCRRAYIWCVRH